MGKKAKAPKKSKPKQKDLPGMEERKIPDLHKAAEDYIEVRDDRMDLTKQESQAKEAVIALLKKHGKEKYKFDDIEVKLVHEVETVKVKRIKAKPEKESEGPAGDE